MHGLTGIGDGDLGLIVPGGVIAHHRAGLVVEGVVAPKIDPVAHGGLEVIAEHALHGGLLLGGVEKLPQPAEIGVPLAGQLIDAAALGDLIFDLAGLLVPVVCRFVEALHDGAVVQIHLVEEIFPVKEVFFGKTACFFI